MDRITRLFDGSWRAPKYSRHNHEKGCPYITDHGTRCSYPLGHKIHSFRSVLWTRAVPCGECVKRNLDYAKAVKAWPWR